MNEHNEDRYSEVPKIERLINIPVIRPDEPFVEILPELKRLRKDDKPVKTKLDQHELIAEYVSFRDRKQDNDWGIIIHRKAFWNLSRAAYFETDYNDVEILEKHLRSYFIKRETFHFFVDRAVYVLENSMHLQSNSKHDLWRRQCGNRLYRYVQGEDEAAENFAWKKKSPGAKNAYEFLEKTRHISANSMRKDSTYGLHRDLYCWILSQYLKTGCRLDDRATGIEILLGLDHERTGVTPTINILEPRENTLQLPFRLL